MLTQALTDLRNRLIVSVQAYPGEPMRTPDTMNRVAQAVVTGGAAAIRCQGLADVELIAATVDVPVIGLWKDGHDGVFITPTLDHARAVLAAGADVVAIDGTRRERPDGLTLEETIAGLRHDAVAKESSLQPDAGVMVMADCGCLDDGLAAADAGADIVGTTLAGYTDERPKTDGPDLGLIEDLARRLSVPIIAEGRIHTPTQARAALDRGAFAVVVGTAITHPSTITSWFVEAL